VLSATKRADMQVDRKKIDLVLLNKRITSTSNSIKQTEKLYSDIIAKLKSKRKGQTQHSEQLKQKITDLEGELTQNQEALLIQQQRLNENEFERANDPQVISNKDVLASYNKLQDNLNQFLSQIQPRQDSVQELKDIWQVLKSELGATQIEQLFALVGI
jgi:chromosome segregation ATPase